MAIQQSFGSNAVIISTGHQHLQMQEAESF